ncbi:transcription factor [Ganoderma sinense ZZ0214-1]|uniref:Transcription factor n=1 Tax=Ganoderma sinense ZZ0214-1 TaxID=1077348 RepID=A0A2G8S601_9APHY|nr:transcription factor [Ganoderma sinense ZZ0214-1]
MSSPKENPSLYAASCNPPRRAKRQRTGSLAEGESRAQPVATSSASTSPQQRRAPARPPILPKQPTAETAYALPASLDSESGSDEDDYNPGRDAAPAPKRRGRKPGAMSRSARESLRKLNHSRIEKARRTKINETLSTLSTLVNERDRVLKAQKPETVAEATVEEKVKKGKGKTEEKEFKLDVLVKTVEYMQDLIVRVQALEREMCTQCRSREDARIDVVSLPPSPKRKRADEDETMADASQPVIRHPHHRHEEEDSYIGDDEHGLGVAEDEQPSPMPFAVPMASAGQSKASPRLPPISSWLAQPYDPSTLISKSPRTMPTRSPANAQLPSPPPSGRFRPALTLANMPSLALPGPAHPLPPLPQKVGGSSTLARQQQHRKSVSASPTVSPTWTPEDETAASMLLQMSVKPRSSSASSASSSVMTVPRGGLPMTPRDELPIGKDRAFTALQQRRSMEAATPGSLLGMMD